MKVLVAGASGQVASCLAKLGENNPLFCVTCLGRPDLDVTQESLLEKIVYAHRPQILVNTAAYTDVERAEDEPEVAMSVNGRGASYLAKIAGKMQIPLIHLSTDYVFSGEKQTPYHEYDDVGPINAYGRSKLDGERAIQALIENFVILRTSWVYSPFGTNFMKTMLKLFQTRNEIDVVADQTGSPTSAWDIAQAILDICAARAEGNPSSGIYHLASTGITTWYGFATAIRDLSRKSNTPAIQVNPIPNTAYLTKARRPCNSALVTKKIEADFGIRLPRWEDSLARCYRQIK